MVRITELEPIYCKYIPADLEQGKLYISKEYSVAIHLCACGCGGKTVTPIKEGEWTIADNNGNVTMRPSIGNWKWQSPYHAHYYIIDNKIQWL